MNKRGTACVGLGVEVGVEPSLEKCSAQRTNLCLEVTDPAETSLIPVEDIKGRAKKRGFSLIELMVSVAIIAVIAAIAVPIYTNQSQRSYVAEVQGDLLGCGQALERLASREWSYSGGDAGGGTVAAAICDPASVRAGRYTMAIAADRDGFTLTATPVVDGVMDDSGIVSIDQAGNQVWDEDGDGVDDHDRNWTAKDGGGASP